MNGQKKADWLNWMNPTVVSTRSTSTPRSCLRCRRERNILSATGTTAHTTDTHSPAKACWTELRVPPLAKAASEGADIVFFIADNWRACHSAYQCWASVLVSQRLSACVSSCSYSGFPVLNVELLKPLEGADPSSAGMASRHSGPASPLAICRRSKQVSRVSNETWNCYFPYPKCSSRNGLWSEVAIKVICYFNEAILLNN